MAPCAGAGSTRSTKKISVARSSSPRRSSPATARTTASSSPRAIRSSRVGTLPRRGSKERSERSARSCAVRRRLEVPTRAPAGSAARGWPPRAHSASSTRARIGTAATARPRLIATGRSLKLCTARSISRASNARSSVEVKNPVPSIRSSGASGLSSPWLDSSTISSRSSGAASRKRFATISVCRCAKPLARVPALTLVMRFRRLGLGQAEERAQVRLAARIEAEIAAAQSLARHLQDAIDDAARDVIDRLQARDAFGLEPAQLLAANRLGAAAKLGHERARGAGASLRGEDLELALEHDLDARDLALAQRAIVGDDPL